MSLLDGDTRPAIVLHRPGTIGDVLMTLNLVPSLKKMYPDHEIRYLCDPSIGDQLETIMRLAGVDVIDAPVRLTESDYEKDVTKRFDLIGYPLREGYPTRPMQRHLLQYFAEEMGVELDPGTLPVLKLPLPPRYASPLDRMPERYATLQVKAGWSVYKEWPIERWTEVVRRCPDIPFYQIGAEDEPRVPGANHELMGRKILDAFDAIAQADLHAGIDSFANHVTHYAWCDHWITLDVATCRDESIRQTRGVILFGSTQWQASGYDHNVNLSLGLSCQPCFREDPRISRMSRGPCVNPPGQRYEEPRHACMLGLTVEQVMDAVMQVWDAEPARRRAIAERRIGT